MAIDSPIAAEPVLAPLDWESRHFGLSAARLNDPELTDQALATRLRHARDNRVDLLVWATEGHRELPQALLDQFGGLLADRKATFFRSLRGITAEPSTPGGPEVKVVAYPSNTASPGLVQLGITAGAYSRFRVDPGFRRERFEAMYRIWIEKSVCGELADAVLIVPADDQGGDAHERPQGMISLSHNNRTASIGLVAVAPALHGRGIGSALMRAGCRWMLERGAEAAEVVTQSTNVPACRLYERAGFQLASQQNYYHFWL